MTSYLPTGLSGGDKFQLAFITSSSGFYAIDVNISDYNTKVNTAWTSSSIKNDIETYLDLSSSIIWKCIGSTDAIHAKNNAVVDPSSSIDFQGVYRLDQTKVAVDDTEMWSGNTPGIQAPINIDENGSSIGGGTHYVWTGTDLGNGTNSGAFYFGYLDMSFDPAEFATTQGLANSSSGENWLLGGGPNNGENTTASLYALSEELTWPADDPPPPEPDEPVPPTPKNLQIKWNSVKNSKYIRFPYESAFNGLKEQISFVEYTDGYHKKINIEKTQDPKK